MPKQDCDSFINFCEKRKITTEYERSLNSLSGQFEKSNYKTVEIPKENVNFSLASSHINHGLQKYIDHLSNFNSFNIHWFKMRLLYPHKIRILKYSTNHHIHPHTDIDFFEHASVTINLNDDYEGGTFSFFNKKYNIDLGKGDILIFPADAFWVHEVTAIKSGTRYAINSFICSADDDARSKFNDIITNKNPIFKYE
ncbi:MAG: 2OG-Fe(II) oxygenase [Alphaproteobacteria bacterium]|nr:2OG-Fe(II) oxygenase [Alphaproteobacteria bacterium]